MSEEFNDDLPVVDELTGLKAKADLMGLSYHPSIGLDKLREKVNAALNDTAAPAEEAPKAVEESPTEFRMRKRAEANELVRIRVACMNPAKKELEGEFFTAGNSVVGSFTKYVPFNTEDGWHVPRIIYNQIIDRMCQIFFTVTNDRGDKIRKGKQIREFAVEVLPELTYEELTALAQRQAMAKGGA